MRHVSDSVADPGRTPGATGRRAGTWKLAYADFLTALVALFLVLWLVKGAPDDGRADLAAYFRGEPAPNAWVLETASEAARPGLMAPTPSGMVLAAALRDSPRLADRITAADIMVSGETVRLDLTDAAPQPLFARGETVLTPAGHMLVRDTARILADLPLGGVEIEAHTDAFPFRPPDGSNWRLSSGRAAAAHDALLAGGLAPERVRGVTGRADTAPRLPAEPHHPINRRITLVLHPTR